MNNSRLAYQTILMNAGDYAGALKELIGQFAVIRNQSDDESFVAEVPVMVERFDMLINDLSGAFLMNRVRLLRYPYAIHIDGDDSKTRIPASKLSSYISSFNRSLNAINHSLRVDLVDVFRGSTVLCFDYTEGLDPSAPEMCSKANDTFERAYDVLTKEEKPEKEIKKVVRNEKTRKALLTSMKGLAPVSGSGSTRLFIHGAFEESSALEFDSNVRQTINKIQPTNVKDERVDWENKTAIGYIREINDVSRTFQLFEKDTDDEEKALIKMHFSVETQEEFAVTEWKKKVRVKFNKIGQNKYDLAHIEKAPRH